MADLASLRELYAWMREASVSYAKCGELELRIEPLPRAAASSVETDTAASPEEEARRNLDDLLFSSGGDVDSFIRAMTRKSA